MMIGDIEDMTKEELNRQPDMLDIENYHISFSFRKKCLDAGYVLIDLYPVYHHGWDMDLWAANAEKDGKKWWLTTNHGGLEAEELLPFSFTRFVKSFLGDVW